MYNDQTITFYNAIAADYDATMEGDAVNKMIRKMVADKFTDTVKKGTILDLGGGTGLDLEWQLKNNYTIFFCEPSEGMRNIAMGKYHDPSIIFLDSEKTNFYNWNKTFPFADKVDAVLCNFAVMNCIPDIRSLFSNLALLMKPGASLFALILDNSFDEMMKRSRRKTILATIFNIPFKFFVHSGSHSQTVYIHTDRSIRNAADKYFKVEKKENWEYGYSLIHLIKK